MRWIVFLLGVTAFMAGGLVLTYPGPRPRGYEARALGGLKTISVAQSIFRLQSGRYATSLAELSNQNLIGPQLGSGERMGYRFKLIASTEFPEYLWLAVTSPTPQISEHAQRHFAVTHAGIVHYAYGQPIPLRPDCTIQDRFPVLGK